MIYLDSAATTLQKPAVVSEAVSNAIGRLASPGRGGHRPAMLAAEVMFQCRQEAMKLFDVPSPDQVVLTCNATHGLNIAIQSLVKPGDTVLISGYEHNAVTRPLTALGANIKVATSPLFEQEILLDDFRTKLTGEVSCAIFTHVSNVFGYILPIGEMAALCRERRIPFILDASQSAGCISISLSKLGAEFIAMPGHKGLYGPQGTGLLLCGQKGRPVLYGGTGSVSLQQEMPDFLPDRLEAGTQNVCGAAGLLEGLRYVRRRKPEEILRHEQALLAIGKRGLSRIGGTTVYASSRPERQTGVLSFRIRGLDCEEAGEQLGRAGIAVRAGYHCAPYAHRSAGTLEGGTVRISVSAFNRSREMQILCDAVGQISKKKSGGP